MIAPKTHLSLLVILITLSFNSHISSRPSSRNRPEHQEIKKRPSPPRTRQSAHAQEPTSLHIFSRTPSPEPCRFVQVPPSPVFSKKRQNIIKLLKQIHVKGNEFEIESAVTLAKEGERIVGFDLDINFKDGTAPVMLEDGTTVEINTTEFDIVSSHYAVECKSSKNPSHNCDIEQFTKEQTMIRWLNMVWYDIQTENLEFGFFKSWKNNRPFVVIKGPSTKDQNIELTSTWFTADTERECIKQFIKIVELLVDKKFCIFFQSEIEPTFGRELCAKGLPYEDKIRIPVELNSLIDPRFLTEEAQMDILNTLLQKLTIDTNPGEEMEL